MLEQFIRQAYAETERIESSGQANGTGTAREVAMIKTKLEEAGALLANAEAKALTGRPLLDLPTLGMIQTYQTGGVDEQIGGPFDRGTTDQLQATGGQQTAQQTAGSAGVGGGGLGETRREP